MSGWQPIATAPMKKFVLVALKNSIDDVHPSKVAEAKWAGNLYWRIHGASFHPDFITHWMPLPEPPHGL
jgi:hypothetical protein